MTNYTKNYIGKGKKNENYDIVTVTIDMEKAEPLIFEYQGKKYLRFEVAAMKETDKFNRTHTAYVSVKGNEEQPAEVLNQNADATAEITGELPGDDLPF